MEAYFFLIPITLLIVLAMLAALFWCFRSKQYDDLDSNASRILHDDE